MDTCEKTLPCRNAYFDNLKVALIFSVVFIHIAGIFATEHVIYNSLYAIIYSFHMPLFIFVSGYFSKDLEKSRNNAFTTFLIPYLIFNTLYTILVNKTIAITIFVPEFLYWYLLSMFFWKLISKDFVRIKFYLVIAVLLGLYCGGLVDVGRFLSLSRTIVFYPFFLLGYWCDSNLILKITKINKSITLSILIITSLLIAYVFNNNLIPQGILFAADSYNALGLSALTGVVYRFAQYCIAGIMCVCILNLIPKKKMKYSHYGSKTMTIYLGHAYLVPIFATISSINYLNEYIGLLLFVIITILTIFFLGNDKILELYTKIMNIFDNFFIKKPNNKLDYNKEILSKSDIYN